MFNVALATCTKNMKSIWRAYPWSFFISRLTMGISVIVFPYFTYKYFFNQNLNSTFSAYTKSSDYITYVALGAAVYVLGVGTLMNIGRALITELREGTLEMFLLSPASRAAYFTGCLFEQIIRSLMEFAIVILIGYLFGANFAKIFTLKSLFVIALTIFSFFSMGLALSSVMLYTRDSYISQNTLFMIISLLCGISSPIEYLPKWAQYLSNIFPTTYNLKLFRSVIMLNQDILSNAYMIIQTIILSLVYLLIGILWYKKIEKKLIEDVLS